MQNKSIHELTSAFQDALGIEGSDVTGFTLHCEYGKLPQLTVYRVPLDVSESLGLLKREFSIHPMIAVVPSSRGDGGLERTAAKPEEFVPQ